jgi:hypothetical protein
LHVRFSGTGYWDEGLTDIKIPAEVTSKIKTNAVVLNVEVLVNGTLTIFVNLSAKRTTGAAVLHISVPWYQPASHCAYTNDYELKKHLRYFLFVGILSVQI